MPVLSLTDFVDVVSKSGTPKLTKIRQVKNRPAYSPATDFWRLLRTRIVEAHEGGHGKRHLRGVLAGLADRKKQTAYPPLVDAYSRWWGRREYQWVPPPYQHWQSGSVRVNVNPELGLKQNQQLFIVKLYFKSEKLTKNKVDVILHLMQETLGSAAPTTAMAIHDVPGRRLITSAAPVYGLAAMLRGEAAYIAAVWDEI